jgi:uncharacterized phage-associated protein
MCIGMQVNKKLIGNIIVLLSDSCKPLYHTKLLKLLYLIDEEATLRTGVPITWLRYNAWQFGPVAEEVFHSKNHGHNKFSDYISFEHKGEHTIIKPLVPFDDSELSELDLEIIKSVIDKFGNKTAKQLVDITHAKDTLWYRTKKRAGIHFSETNTTSDTPLNMVELIENDDLKKTVYYATLENMEMQSTLV